MLTSNKPPLTPYWRSDCGRAIVYLGDCRTILPQLPPEQFHAVVTDPPYELTSEASTKRSTFPGRYAGTNGEKRGFMGHKWDGTGVAFDPATWSAVLQVVRPGAHLLSFGGTRTLHRMVCAIEDVGWTVRDIIMWTYGSGFPKSMDISKQIDKMQGVDRDRTEGGSSTRKDDGSILGLGHSGSVIDDQPVTENAKIWSGWGSSLKPAVEPVCVARKPMAGTTASNVLEHGTGAINIDACRVGTEQVGWGGANGFTNTHNASERGGLGSGGARPVEGRFPSNFIHDGSNEVLDLLPQSSSTKSEVTSTPGFVYSVGDGLPSHTGVYGLNDSGSAARFFYTAKADDSDRPHGKHKDTVAHPTVKPLDLMQYLVRLICPRGGTVLDPFMGSGSTGCAAIAEGMKFVGIEQDEKYADIAVGRLKLALQSAPSFVELKTREAIKVEKDVPPPPKPLKFKYK